MSAPHGLCALAFGLLLHTPGVAAEPDPAAVEALTSVAEVRALVVLGEDSTALEWYRTPADAGATNVKSASKSVLSALIGITLERERIAGLDAAVAELLPEHADLLSARPRGRITLRHLLSMTAGLESTSGAAYGAWVSGDRIVPAEWVATATTRAAEGWPERYGAYGLGWWLPGGGPFLAVGFGGQFLWVDPEHRTVVVVTSTPSQKDAAWDRRVLDLVRRIAAAGA